ncbi:MAG TPA: hypothetical protein DCE23_03245 [Firmicutes bacterium]|nr:hypothetical protein [Bacillota bacterium]
MMEWYIGVILIIVLINIQGSISRLAVKMDNGNKVSSKNRKSLILENYVGKKVCLEIDNDDINNSYLFSSTLDTIGEIVEYDNEWILFRYEEKKKMVSQYFRRKDVTGIYEVTIQNSNK